MGLWTSRVCGKTGEMKSFYSPVVGTSVIEAPSAVPRPLLPTNARVAVYDGAGAAPRVEEVSSASITGYIEALSSRVYELVRERGGDIPYTVIREVSENFIHADFAEPVVSILDDGATVRFADQGPGITDKERAVLPGFTTACARMKQHIRGVGSGLPIVRDYLSISGGDLVIEDNLGCGAVVTVRSGRVRRSVGRDPAPPRVAQGASLAADGPDTRWAAPPGGSPAPLPLEEPPPAAVARPRLSTRQKQVLALVMESGSAGPSLVSKELGVAISTAYRDLASLEDLALISADSGKRRLTDEGLAYLKDMMSGY